MSRGVFLLLISKKINHTKTHVIMNLNIIFFNDLAYLITTCLIEPKVKIKVMSK